ncbi:hypothetical protein OESDEN_15845 [Oesophagostomum dentatum]|uniref:Uncharacterized protein n=1 Tax=Oesophagostomum dentatum TaxID=61180 RepID=A0A0B1SKM2_OESDE|nr:hypothetical protein OESDEN_15845 [Oesophagostomum dentatum]
MACFSGDGWTRGEVQLMGLAGIVFVMTVVFFGVSILNCFGRLRHRRQQLQKKQHKAAQFLTPTPLQIQSLYGDRIAF